MHPERVRLAIRTHAAPFQGALDGDDRVPRALPWADLPCPFGACFPPTVFVSHLLDEDAVSPEALENPSPPAADVPHEGPQAGCGCPHCQSGASHAFPGYDKLGYSLHGGCPPAVISEAWCRRPFFADLFIGAISGDEFINGEIGQQTSLLAGGRLGWDLSGDWGCEARLALAEVHIHNMSGLAERRQADLLMADVSLVHYFGLDLTIRPYMSVGLGVVDWGFVDVDGNAVNEKVMGVPIAMGVKQRCDDWLVLRLDLTDNIAFGGGTRLGTQHNISVTGNVEIRFGGPRTSYWAWTPRKHYSW
jgi:hypothetical protein